MYHNPLNVVLVAKLYWMSFFGLSFVMVRIFRKYNSSAVHTSWPEQMGMLCVRISDAGDSQGGNGDHALHEG
jgi:hypothetical protein